MRNENGFVFPLTLSIALFSLFIVVTNVNIYIRDIQFYEQTNKFLEMENLTLIMVQHSSQNLIDGKKETVSLPIGTITYQVESVDAQNIKVTYSCKTKNNLTYTGAYIYDTGHQQIVNWFEF